MTLSSDSSDISVHNNQGYLHTAILLPIFFCTSTLNKFFIIVLIANMSSLLDLLKKALRAAKEDTTLETLEGWLTDLDNASSKELRLSGVSFETTFNHSLGLPNDPLGFTVFAPWKSWPQEAATLEAIEEQAKVPQPQGNTTTLYPTALQGACLEILDANQPKDTENPFIDLASLKPDSKIFLESGNGKPSVAAALAEYVNSFPDDAKPVIRFLVGTETSRPPTQAWKEDAHIYNEIFFGPGPDGKPLFRHPEARLYVGYYVPSFKPE